MTPCVGNVVLRRKPQYHILCECEVLASLRHAYLGSFSLDPEDVKELGMGAIWNFAKGTVLLWPSTDYEAQRPRCIGPGRARTPILFYSFLTPGKTHYPLHKRLGGLQGQSGQASKISFPAKIHSPGRPALSELLYRLGSPSS
jgi:hypothetical protein